tara:strand:+ start:196 stop:345 length:150 start_codon:yes stop_codon:yes gene_type:complete
MPISRSQIPKEVEGKLRGARKGSNDKRRQFKLRTSKKMVRNSSRPQFKK